MPTNSSSETTWHLHQPGRPSLDKILKKFQDALLSTPIFPRGIPLALHVIYRVSGSAWRVKGENTPELFHLAAPAAYRVANACGEALARAGLVEPGQIGLQTAYKVTSTQFDNFLDVTVSRMTERACIEDIATMQHKVAKWYLDRAETTGRVKSYREYRAILKALRDKEG